MNIMIFTKNWIGDAIFAEPLIRYVKRQSPDATVICVCPPRCMAFLKKNPHIDHIIAFDEKGNERSLLKRLLFVLRIRSLKVDRVYLLHRSFTRAVLCFLAGIPLRIGYYTKKRARFLTTAVHGYDHEQRDVHDVDLFLGLVPGHGLSDTERRYRFYFDDEDTRYVYALLQEHALKEHQCIAINPGANWPPKRWFPDRFARLADMLYEQYHMPIIITGAADNQTLADEIMGRVKTARCFSMCGKTTLTQVGALFALCRCVVTADSGPMHIASGVGADVVALFGPTDFIRTGPCGVGKSIVICHRTEGFVIPCYDDDAGRACMRNITPEMVAEAVDCLMQEKEGA